MHGDVLSDESSKLVVTYNSLQHMELEQSTMLANCLYQLVHRGGDKMNDDAVWLQILSCSYIGSFDLDASTKDTWAKTFSEALSMSGMGTKSYAINKAITIVIGTIKTFLVDTSWLRRSQALLVLKDIIQSVRFSDLEISEVIPMLLYMIRGSVWSGKSLLLETIVEILLQNKDNFVSNSETKILFISGETKDFVASQVMDANANNDSTFILTTDDLLVKKEFQNVMVSVADDDTETSSFAISKTGSEQSKDSIISRLTKKPFWTVNVINLVSVLLRESQKSDKDYRFAAAKALALFPWNYLSSKFTKLLRVFISQFRDMAGAYTNLLQNVQPIENAVITESDRKRRSTASSRPATKQKTAFYFGNRYANATPPIPSTTDKNLIAPPLVGLTTDNSNEMVIANVADSSIVVETSTELEENYQEMVTSVENESKHGNIVDDSINDEAVPVTMKTARVEDPAFRLQFINCIARCWPPIDSMDSDSKVPQEDIVDLIDWTFLVMKHEVWSIRKAALELVGTIAKLETLAETTIGIVISVISLAMQESKYTKVKVEGVKALGNLITGPNKSMIKEQFSNRIRLIIREASTDGQPSILEAVAVVQEAWITV